MDRACLKNKHVKLSFCSSYLPMMLIPRECYPKHAKLLFYMGEKTAQIIDEWAEIRKTTGGVGRKTQKLLYLL